MPPRDLLSFFLLDKDAEVGGGALALFFCFLLSLLKRSKEEVEEGQRLSALSLAKRPLFLCPAFQKQMPLSSRSISMPFLTCSILAYELVLTAAARTETRARRGAETVCSID